MADGAIFKEDDWGGAPLLSRILGRWRQAAVERSRVAFAASRVGEAPTADLATAAELDRATIRQWLFGRGYLVPGDAGHVLSLVEPLELRHGSSLIDLAAGLGGPARAIAQAFHAHVTGLERDSDLARRGAAMSVAQGLARLVRIRACDPESIELDSARFDCALGREATGGIVEKERFLRVVVQSLKPRGQLILADFLRDRGAGERDEVAAWEDGQSRKPSLWTLAQYADCLKSLGFNLRVAEDLTPFYRRQLVAAWIALWRGGELRRLGPAQIETVVAEGECCMRTLKALESGALKYYRLGAIAHWSFW